VAVGVSLGVGVGRGLGVPRTAVDGRALAAGAADAAADGAAARGAAVVAAATGALLRWAAGGACSGLGRAAGGEGCCRRAGGVVDGGSPAPKLHPSTDPGGGSRSAAPVLLNVQVPPGWACQ
jgi:hypothetical protein